MKRLGFTGFRWGIRPDVGVLWKNGSRTIIEITSHSQTKALLYDKLIDFSIKYGLDYEPKVYNPVFLPFTLKKSF